MYSEHLIIGIENYTKEVDEYEYSYNHGSMCSFCGEDYKKSYTTSIYSCEKKTRSCFLCNTVVNFKNFCMGKCFLILSDLTQQEINSKILKYYNKHNTIPYAKYIDKKCKLVNISIHEFVNCYCVMTDDEKKIFSNFKIYFTSNANQLLTTASSKQIYFNTDSTIEDIITDTQIKKYDVEYFNLKLYDLSDKQKKIILEKKILYNKKYNDAILEIKKSIDVKVKNANKLSTFINTLK